MIPPLHICCETDGQSIDEKGTASEINFFNCLFVSFVDANLTVGHQLAYDIVLKAFSRIFKRHYGIYHQRFQYIVVDDFPVSHAIKKNDECSDRHASINYIKFSQDDVAVHRDAVDIFHMQEICIDIAFYFISRFRRLVRLSDLFLLHLFKAVIFLTLIPGRLAVRFQYEFFLLFRLFKKQIFFQLPADKRQVTASHTY